MDGHLGELREVPGAYNGTLNQSQGKRTPMFIQDKESLGNNSLYHSSVEYGFSSHLFCRQSLRSRRECATLCSVSRGLHLYSMFFCRTRTNRGHTVGGTHTGFFFLFSCLFWSCRHSAVLAFISYRGKGSAVPIPRRQSRIVSTHETFSISLNRFPLPGTKMRKSLSRRDSSP